MHEKTYNHSDQELIQGIKNGDETALTLLHEKYRSRLIREAVFLVKDLDDAEDIVQEIFIAVWNRRKEIAVGPTLLPYLLKATWNVSIKRLHKQVKQEERDRMYYYLSEKITNDEPFDQEELARLLDKALQLVPPAARRSFMLQYMEGHNQQSVALQQNISLQVVKNNVSQALKILRRALGSKKSL